MVVLIGFGWTCSILQLHSQLRQACFKTVTCFKKRQTFFPSFLSLIFLGKWTGPKKQSYSFLACKSYFFYLVYYTYINMQSNQSHSYITGLDWQINRNSWYWLKSFYYRQPDLRIKSHNKRKHCQYSIRFAFLAHTTRFPDDEERQKSINCDNHKDSQTKNLTVSFRNV